MIFKLGYAKIEQERMWIMIFDKIFKIKNKQDLSFVNFRHRGELSFGYIYEVFVDDEKKVTYTIQIGGQCPAFLYSWKEEDILGLKTK